jgi:LmbE family N-acetylglucosaminyl deacetylase
MVDIPESALVISAHPDDLDFGCCGTVALWRGAGVRVVYLICTNGDKGTEDQTLSAETLAIIRQREQTEAARVVGVEVLVFLGFEDGELENTPILRKRLVETIRRIRPQVVLCQDPAHRTFENVFVSHRDHRAAAEASFDALYPASNNRRFFPELLAKGLEPHRVQEVFFFGTHAPNHWVDITAVIDLKLKSLSCHKSQIATRADFESVIREHFREMGKRAGYDYAEGFRRIPIPA